MPNFLVTKQESSNVVFAVEAADAGAAEADVRSGTGLVKTSNRTETYNTQIDPNPPVKPAAGA